MTKIPLFMNQAAKGVENWKLDLLSDKSRTAIMDRNGEHIKTVIFQCS